MHRSIFSIIALTFVAILLPGLVSAQSTSKCSFTRTLEIGSTGEDVRCLQKFLNANGFIISTSGVGSPGFETNQYQAKTKDAVKKWQESQGIFPATGNFGPLSKAKYLGGNGVTVVTPPVVVTPPQVSDAENQARSDLATAIDSVNNFIEYIDDQGKDEVEDEEKALKKAQVYLVDAFSAFIDKRYNEVGSLVANVKNSISKYEDDIDEKGNKSQAKEDINDARDRLDELEADIEEAKDDGDDVGDAEDYFEDAEGHYSNAKDAYSDEDYEDVADFLDDMDEEIDNAYDALDSDSDDNDNDGDESDAEDAREDAEDAISDLEDAISEAEDDDRDINDAEDYLSDAEDLFDDLEDAFDDEDWDEVLDLADEIEDVVDDGLDEIED